MRCYYHERCGQLDLVAPVLLLCDCLVGVCQECAKKELLITFPSERHKKKVMPGTEIGECKYEAYLCCPQCQGKVSSKKHNIIKGVDNALEAEEKLILAAMTDAGMSYFKHSTDLAELERCWNISNDDDSKPIKSEPGVLSEVRSPNPESEAVQVARLRKKLASLALKHYPHYDNPLDALSFTTNSILGRIHEQPSQNTTREGVSGVTECIVCTNTLQVGFSVQLTCICNHILCRNCALINIHYRPETYHSGVNCPQCRTSSPGVLQNTHTVREIEDLLVQSGRQYLTNRLLTFRDQSLPENERQNYLQMIKLYHAIGYEGNLNVLNEKERDSATVARLKLEVAKLEEFRLNQCGEIDSYSIRCDMNNSITSSANTSSNSTYSNETTNVVENGTTSIENSSSHIKDFSKLSSNAGKFPIGFLHALKVSKNTFFEHFYLRNNATVDKALDDCQGRCATLLMRLRDVVYSATSSKLDLLDKLVLVCMKVQSAATVTSGSPAVKSTNSVDATATAITTDSITSDTATTSTSNDTEVTISSTTSVHSGYTINQMVVMLWNYLKHPDLQYHKYLNSANLKSEFMSIVYRKVTPQTIQACLKKLILNNFVSLVTNDLALHKDERYTLTDQPFKAAQLDPFVVDSLLPDYYKDNYLLTPSTTTSTTPSSTAAIPTSSIFSSGLPRSTTLIDSDRLSPPVVKVYSARAMLIDPNRPVKKKKTPVGTSNTSSSSSSGNRESSNTDGSSSSSNIAIPTASNVININSSATSATTSLPTFSATNSTVPATTTSILKKRGPGRPPNAEKAIAESATATVITHSDTHDTTTATGTAGATRNKPTTSTSNKKSPPPEERKFIFVRDPVTGKNYRKYLDTFDAPTTPATAATATTATTANPTHSDTIGNKRSSTNGRNNDERDSGLVDTSDDEATSSKRRRKVQKVLPTTGIANSSSTIGTLQSNRSNDSGDYCDPRLDSNENDDDNSMISDGSVDGNSNSDNGNDSNNSSNNNSDQEGSTHSIESSNNTQQEQLQEMINSLKRAASEAFKDAARVREENKLLRTELASLRNNNVPMSSAQKVDLETLKTNISQLKEQLKREQAQRQVLEQEKSTNDAARLAEKRTLETKIATLQQQHRVLHEACEKHKSSLTVSQSELRTIRENSDKLSTQVDKLKNANFRFKKEKEDAEKELENTRKAHFTALAAKEKVIKQLQDDVNSKNSASQAGEAECENVRRNYNTALLKVNATNEELRKLQKQYDDLAARNATYESELKSLKRELNEVRDKNGQQKEEIKELTMEVDSLKKIKHRRESEEKQAQEDIQSLLETIHS